MRPYQTLFAMVVMTGAAVVPVLAQNAKPAPAKPAPSAPAASASVSAVPQQTTASFGDWTLRCAHPSDAAELCEVVQSISNQERPVAQIALGRPAKGQQLHLTILVPTNISLTGNPVLSTTHEGDPPVLDMTWRRCLPGGCFADASLSDAILQRLRTSTEPARVTFPDAAGRNMILPFSPRGLPQALDALAKEEPG